MSCCSSLADIKKRWCHLHHHKDLAQQMLAITDRHDAAVQKHTPSHPVEFQMPDDLRH
jgi:hypothetical protein